MIPVHQSHDDAGPLSPSLSPSLSLHRFVCVCVCACVVSSRGME